MDQKIVTTYFLTQDEIKQAIVEYMDKRYDEDFVLEEIELSAEVNAHQEVEQVVAECTHVEHKNNVE